MTKHFLILKKLLPFLFIIIAYLSCTSSTTGSESETEMEIALSGIVKNEVNIPMKGVSVSLSKFNLSDTTDSLGHYDLSDTVDISLMIKDSIVDTLLFEKDSSVLKRVVVSNFKDTVNVTVIQRAFTCPIVGEFPAYGSAFLVLTTMNDIDTIVSSFELGYIASTKTISGYGLFPINSTDTYSAYIKILDQNGNLSGRSVSNEFTKIYGPIDFPAFNAINMLPEIVGLKSPIEIGDSLGGLIQSSATGDLHNSDSIFNSSIKQIYCEIGEDTSYMLDKNIGIFIPKKNYQSGDSLNIKVSVMFNTNDTSYMEKTIKLIDSLIWDYNTDMVELFGEYWGVYSYLDTPTTVSINSDKFNSGSKSLLLESSSTSDVAFSFPGTFGAIPIRELKESDSLTFWVYTENIGGGFEHKSPVIVFRTDDYGYDYMEYHYKLATTPLDEANGNWTYISFPLGGNTEWERIVAGSATLSDVNQIRIHADGLQPDFKVYIDNVIIKEAL